MWRNHEAGAKPETKPEVEPEPEAEPEAGAKPETKPRQHSPPTKMSHVIWFPLVFLGIQKTAEFRHLDFKI